MSTHEMLTMYEHKKAETHSEHIALRATVEPMLMRERRMVMMREI
jgi:hypothetical protein